MCATFRTLYKMCCTWQQGEDRKTLKGFFKSEALTSAWESIRAEPKQADVMSFTRGRVYSSAVRDLQLSVDSSCHWLLQRKDELIDMSAAGEMNIWRALRENNEVFIQAAAIMGRSGRTQLLLSQAQRSLDFSLGAEIQPLYRTDV